MKTKMHVLVGTTAAKNHCFLTKVKTLNEKEFEMSQLKTLDFPQNARYALLRTMQKKKIFDERTHSQAEQYMFK